MTRVAMRLREERTARKTSPRDRQVSPSNPIGGARRNRPIWRLLMSSPPSGDVQQRAGLERCATAQPPQWRPARLALSSRTPVRRRRARLRAHGIFPPMTHHQLLQILVEPARYFTCGTRRRPSSCLTTADTRAFVYLGHGEHRQPRQYMRREEHRSKRCWQLSVNTCESPAN